MRLRRNGSVLLQRRSRCSTAVGARELCRAAEQFDSSSILCRLENGSHVARCIAIRVANEDEWRERRAVIKQCDIQLNEDDGNAKKLKKGNKKSQK